jgi:hypothetical protein
VLENRELWRIFGQKRNEVTGGWIKLHNEEHYKSYFKTYKIRVIKSMRMK